MFSNVFWKFWQFQWLVSESEIWCDNWRKWTSELYALKSRHAIAAHGNIQNLEANQLPVKRSGSWKKHPPRLGHPAACLLAGEKAILRLVHEVAATPVRVRVPADAAVCTASSPWAQQGANSLQRLRREARGEWERKVPWHPRELMHVGGISVLFRCKSKAENKARLSEARFSLSFPLLCASSQPCRPTAQPPPAAHIRWAGWALPPLAICCQASPGAGKERHEIGRLSAFWGWQPWQSGPILTETQGVQLYVILMFLNSISLEMK